MRFGFVLSARRLMCFLFISLISVSAYSQYCTPASSLGCLTGDYPNQFSMTGTSLSINDPSLTCTGSYQDRTATDTCEVVSPSPTVNCTITSNLSSTYSTYTTFTYSGASTIHSRVTESCQLWVDWNNNDTFETSESIGGMEPLPNSPLAFTVTIPPGIAAGFYRMRLVLSSVAAYPSMDPCMKTSIFGIITTDYASGTAIDYTIEVGVACTTPTVTFGASTCTSQVINWTAIAGSGGYEYVVNTTAGAPTGSGTATTGTTYTATGLTPGTTYYAHVLDSCGPGYLSTWVNVPFTTSGPSSIKGTTALCPTSSTILSDATAGGTWSSSTVSVATIASGGFTVYGVGAGLTTITYTEGGCTALTTVTVAPLPAITGVTNVCPGSTTQLSDAIPGGAWSSSTASVATVTAAGLVHGAAAGTTTITYSINGCSSTEIVTVSALPPITGGATVCAGLTLPLNDATGGGTWSSSSNTIATVSSTGVVTGVAAGSATITYTTGSCNTTLVITVGNALAAITGTTTFCVTSTTTLSDVTPGGVWSSGDVSVATVSGTAVHGVTGGTATISYTAGGCSATDIVTVVPNNGGTITGRDTVCIGTPITLSDAQAGGTWSSSSSTHATVNASTGVVSGVGYGVFTITYSVTNLCGNYTVTRSMHVLTGAQCAAGIAPVAVGQNAELKVFPNPNSGTFTMSLVSDNTEEVHVVITNIVGQKVSEFITVTNKPVDIKLNAATGIYLLSATTSHGKYVSKVEINSQ